MSKNDFQEFICRPYCMFFKDGKKEEMACRGAQVVELLAQKKQINRITIPPLTKNPGLWVVSQFELIPP
ncbi:MAG: hypothetical protein HY742_06005 [Deltaproteobacteria bacterium]|nr:hypothetical protein [Deltaproteobacteria bacterium]